MINKAPSAHQEQITPQQEELSTGGPHFKVPASPPPTDEVQNPSYAVEGESRPDLSAEEFHPPADFMTRFIMLNAVVWPFIGCFIAAAMMWAHGWMGWEYVAMVVIGWSVTCLGITVGFHRLMSHKSFETYRWVRALLMMVGAFSVEGSPIVWCAVHRRHHGHSDQEGDPHSPHLHGDSMWGMIKGFCYAQVGWLFSGYWTKPNLEKYVPDLLKDKMLLKIDRHYYVFVLASLVLPAVAGYFVELYSGGSPWFGALLGFIWGGLVRIFVSHHITWSINSVCHVFGKRHFHSNDHSTNNALCGILAMGEGWHNNHHAFPSSAKHGLLWYQFDMSWIVIRTMKAFGLAWNVKQPSERAIQARRIK